MKPNSSRIAIVLDRSGSMETVRQATIDGFNEFISGQRLVADECRVRLVQFNHTVSDVYDLPLADVPPLTLETFIPGGNTALFDAMGSTIESLGNELRKLPEEQRPEHVIVVTLTDGEENASKIFDQRMIAYKVGHQRGRYNWEFIFLGANQDAVLTAQGFGIPMRAAMTYHSNNIAVRNVMRSTAAYSNSIRSGAQNVAFSQQDRLDAEVDQ